MRNIIHIIIVIFCTLCVHLLNAQENRNGSVQFGVVYEGDTIPHINFPTFTIESPRVFKSAKEKKRYEKLERDIMIVYPYAHMAGVKFNEYAVWLDTMESDKQRKVFLKQLEKELENEFGNELRDLTISQGSLLIKLVDRQTGHTSYDILKDMRGSFSAFFWQSMARLFGHNLKENYDAEGDEQFIEEIVAKIEDGSYPVLKKSKRVN
jgi:hypothetical protein